MDDFKKSLVITSINTPNKVLKKYAALCKKNDVEFILMGDRKSPNDFNLTNCNFWSIDRQHEMFFSDLEQMLPENHYSRKNMGYIIAMKKGNNVIIETDDDNTPYSDFFELNDARLKVDTILNKGWVNVYNAFTSRSVWPRGYPLELISKSEKDFNINSFHIRTCPIQQGLADGDPDVDSIFRMLGSPAVTFKKDRKVALGNNVWSPFNSQNTVWHKPAFLLMYLPSFCSFRMTDIWRSFIAQRICWENNWNILFFSPTVFQNRNKHNLLKDFEDEIPGYLNNDYIRKILTALELKKGEKNIAANMIKCYIALVENGLINKSELNLLRAWIDDVNEILKP